MDKSNIEKKISKIGRLSFALCILTFALLGSNASAGISRETARKALTTAEFADGITLHDYTLTDQDGREFHLKEYFGKDKPLLVSFIYTSCAMVCPTITDSLLASVKDVRKNLGDRFNVLTVGFDAEHDTPESLKRYGYNFEDAFENMRFAAGSEETIKKLTKEFGFYYKKTGRGFEHMSMVSVVSSEGRIYSQVYASRFSAKDIAGPLEELLTGRLSVDTPPSLIDRIKQFCASYDPATGRYNLNYPTIISIFIQLAVLLAIAYFILASRIKRKR